MIKYRNKIIERKSHGLSRTYLVRTYKSAVKPEPITCFASYRVNTRPLIDWQAPSSDESRRQIRLHFTYSRNNGPIQRVMIDDNTENWDAIDLLYSKLDSDLCRAQDGESLAFYLLSDGMGVMEQVIPDLNDTHMPVILLPPIEATRMARSNVPEQPTYDYTITGISGDGLIPIKGVFNVDARKIAIPQPASGVDLDDIDGNYPRWYPSNNIVKEDNTIVIYPSDNIDDFDFDLFRALGGEGNTPITITSCVKAVPRKYICEASHVVGSQVSPLMETRVATRMAMSRGDASVNSNREPVRFSDAPFPFKPAGWRGDTVSWPPSIHDELSTRGHDWIASYRRNDGPLKVITWNTGPRESGAQHSVWDAIKELLLDDYGRTAFMLSNFNSTASSYNDDGEVTVKSGIGSNLKFTTKPSEEGEPLDRSNQPYRYSGKSVEVRDRQIQFSDESAGAVWNENTITIYPTHYSVANEYGFDGHSDYYDYLCQYVDQQQAGEPITIHSCAAVEPADHIQVNTGFKIDTSVMGEVMPLGLIARVQINDGEIKEFANEGELIEKTMGDLVNYVALMGADPIVTSNPAMVDDSISYSRAKSKTNLLYFKATMFSRESAISGCSGIERPNDPRMALMNIYTPAQKVEMLEVKILDEKDSDIPYVRTSNKVTFHRAVGTKYVDFFDLIVGAKGNTHTIYSSAGVPCLLLGNPLDGGGDDDESMDDLEHKYMQWRKPWVFKLTKTNGKHESFNPTVSAIYGSDFVINDYDTGERLASSFGRTHEGIIERIPENNNLDIIFDMNKLGTSRTFELHFGITGGSVIFGNDIISSGPKEGELEVIEWNSDCAPKVKISAANMTVKLPQTLPKEWTSLNSMFTYTNMANPDISMWDVSHVVDMEYMFKDATGFNQDLSNWCVQRMSSEPYNFRKNAVAWNKPQPVWGTCPKEEITLPEDAFVVELTKYRNGYYSASKSDVGIVRTARSGANWQLHNILTGELLCDQNGIYNYNVIHDANSDDTTYIKLPLNQKMTVGMTGEFGGVKMYVGVTERYSDDMTIYGAVNILQYPSTVLSIEHAVEGYELTIPHELPSGLTTLDKYFMDSNLFNQDISHWDISAIGSTNSMFNGAKSFNQDISKWDVSNVHAMTTMFSSAQAFNQDLSQWCVKHIDGPGYQWDYNTPNWTLPKPVWGTCPEKTSVKLIVTSNDTSDSEGRLALQLEGVVGEWSLYEDGVKVIDNNSTSSINTNVGLEGSTLYINLINLRNTVREFEVFATADNLKISQSSMYDVYRDVNVVKFSNDINNYIFELPKCTLSVPETLPTHITSTKNMFNGCNSFNQDLSKWDVSNVTDMDSMFQNCKIFDSSIANWNVSNVTTMQYIFSGCHIFNSELNNWNVSKVVSMRQMFSDCNVFNQDLSKWDVSNVTNMEGLFTYATAFNHDLSTWNTSSVTNMKSMFESAVSFNKPIGNWNVSKVTNMNSIFLAASSFNQDIGSWNVSNVWPMYNMFEGATSFNQDLSKWCVSQHDKKPYMFDNNAIAWTMSRSRPIWGTCPPPPTHMPEYTPFEFNVTSSGGAGFALETSGAPTEWMLYQDDVLITTEETRSNHRVSDLKEGVTNFKLFTDGASINMREGSAGTNTTIDFLSFCEAVPRTNFSIQSYNFTVPKTLPANHTDLRDMFKGCNAFNQDLSEWDTSRVTDMSQMFYETSVFNGNITTWNTSQVTNFTRMFSSARVFNQDISNWDVSNALYMGGMFDIALVFNQPIGNWDIAKVTSAQDMFKNAWEFNQDLSSWNVSNVQSMNGMFFVAKTFNQDLSGWNVAHISDEPINFANLAAAWSEPKPVWGTDGKSSKVDFTDAFEFNVTSPLNGRFELSMSDVVGSYSIYVDNVLHSTGSETYPGKIFRDIPQGSVNYKIIANCAALKLMTTSGYTLTDLTVTSFGNNINIARFSLGNIKLTVPATLPSHMTNLSGMFSGSYKFNQDLSGWDVSRVTNMSSMFYQAKTFNGNISNWDMSNVTDMTLMLKSCELFNQDISGWNVSKCTKMTELLYSAEIFNQDISGWQVGSVSNMDRMFYAAKKFNQDLSGWNVGLISVEPSSFAPYTPVWVLPKPIWGTNGKPIVTPPVPPTDTPIVTPPVPPTGTPLKYKLTSMVDDTPITISLKTTASDWTIYEDGAVIATAGGVLGTKYTKSITGDTINITRKFREDYVGIFEIYGQLDLVNISHVNVNDTTYCDFNLISFGSDVTNHEFNIQRSTVIVPTALPGYVTNTRRMFKGCDEFNQNISTWNTVNVTDMSEMFSEAIGFNQPIGTWNTSNVTNLNNMFNGATSFNQPIGSWNVSKVTDMGCMFKGCESFNQPIDSWNVSKVTSMNSMFDGCGAFNRPLNNWDTSGVTDMSYMFKETESFNSDISNWDVSNVVNMSHMFESCDLFNQDLSTWKPSKIETTPLAFDKGASAWVRPRPKWTPQTIP